MPIPIAIRSTSWKNKYFLKTLILEISHCWNAEIKTQKNKQPHTDFRHVDFLSMWPWKNPLQLLGKTSSKALLISEYTFTVNSENTKKITANTKPTYLDFCVNLQPWKSCQQQNRKLQKKYSNKCCTYCLGKRAQIYACTILYRQYSSSFIGLCAQESYFENRALCCWICSSKTVLYLPWKTW